MTQKRRAGTLLANRSVAMDTGLLERIDQLDDFACHSAVKQLVGRLSSKSGVRPTERPVQVTDWEAEASRALQEAFPSLAPALNQAQVDRAPQNDAALYRSFLVEFASQAQTEEELDWLADALDEAEQSEIEQAGLPPLLLAIGIVMLLQTKFDVQYERIDGKAHLKISVSKKPSSETVVGKILAPILHV